MSYALSGPAPVRRGASSGPDRARTGVMLVVFLLVAAVAASAALLAVVGAVLGWYEAAPRVTWAPPPLLLALPRWVLATLLGVAEWLVWTRRRSRPVSIALVLFVVQQAASTVWPILFFAGFRAFGTGDLWTTAGLLLLTDLVAAAVVALFWPVSRTAAVLVALHLALTVVSTALVLGSVGMHAVL